MLQVHETENSLRKRSGVNAYLHTLEQGWGPIYYHGPHKLWVIAGGPQMTIDFILKFYLYLDTRDSGFL